MILQFCNIRLYGVVVYTLSILPAVVILFIFPPVSSQTLTHVHCGAAACTVALPTQSVTKITDFNGATRTRPCCYYYYFVIHMRKEQKKKYNTIGRGFADRPLLLPNAHALNTFPLRDDRVKEKKKIFQKLYARNLIYAVRGFLSSFGQLLSRKNPEMSRIYRGVYP